VLVYHSVAIAASIGEDLVYSPCPRHFTSHVYYVDQCRESQSLLFSFSLALATSFMWILKKSCNHLLCVSLMDKTSLHFYHSKDHSRFPSCTTTTPANPMPYTHTLGYLASSCCAWEKFLMNRLWTIMGTFWEE